MQICSGMDMRVFGSRRYGFVPGPASGGHRDDLLVWLHGSTQSATVTRRFTNCRFEHLGMSVAYPEGVARHWNDGRRLLQEKTRELGTNDVEYLTEFVHSFECTGRVFGAGFSNGGHMIYRLLHEAPGLFDAALVIAATQPTPENFLPAPPTTRPVAAYSPAPHPRGIRPHRTHSGWHRARWHPIGAGHGRLLSATQRGCCPGAARHAAEHGARGPRARMHHLRIPWPRKRVGGRGKALRPIHRRTPPIAASTSKN